MTIYCIIAQDPEIQKLQRFREGAIRSRPCPERTRLIQIWDAAIEEREKVIRQDVNKRFYALCKQRKE